MNELELRVGVGWAYEKEVVDILYHVSAAVLQTYWCVSLSNSV